MRPRCQSQTASSKCSRVKELGSGQNEQSLNWTTLKHNGPIFPKPYIQLPPHVKLYYGSEPVQLSPTAEEAAGLYAKLSRTKLAQKRRFQNNFFNDFFELLQPNQKLHIENFSLLNFNQIYEYYNNHEKCQDPKMRQQLKQLAANESERFGFCEVDGQREAIANYRIEPPGIFQGRGNHPLSGHIKERVQPEDVTINCSPHCVPQAPAGHRWAAVQHDAKVSWLARWRDSLGTIKYMLLSSSSRLRCSRDLIKYDTARRLSKHLATIRESYTLDCQSNDMWQCQRGVALYLIDKLSFRIGNEKDANTADTDGCCTLKVKHLQLLKEFSGVADVVVFDFLGKDAIKFKRKVAVQSRVFDNLCWFVNGKKSDEFVFDVLNAKSLNKHLNSFMSGLTAKVFRTHHACMLLQTRLDELTWPTQCLRDKLNAYTKANAEAAKLCNHQRSPTKANTCKMRKLKQQIRAKQSEIAKTQSCIARNPSRSNRQSLRKLKSELSGLELTLSNTTLHSTMALNTSKTNYLDPRITVAWCRRNYVPIQKIYRGALLSKFNWAIEATDTKFRF